MLDIKKLLTKLTVWLSSPIIIQEFSSSGGITLNAYAGGSLNVNVTTPTGYTPLAVVYSRSNGEIWVNYPDSSIPLSTVKVWLRNPRNVSGTISSVTVGVLFVKTP